MNNVELIKKQLLDKTNYITTNSVIEALENEELFGTLRAYSQLNPNKKTDFRRLISKDFIDDLTFSLLIQLSDKEKKELLKHLKPSNE